MRYVSSLITYSSPRLYSTRSPKAVGSSEEGRLGDEGLLPHDPLEGLDPLERLALLDRFAVESLVSLVLLSLDGRALSECDGLNLPAEELRPLRAGSGPPESCRPSASLSSSGPLFELAFSEFVVIQSSDTSSCALSFLGLMLAPYCPMARSGSAPCCEPCSTVAHVGQRDGQALVSVNHDRRQLYIRISLTLEEGLVAEARVAHVLLD